MTRSDIRKIREDMSGVRVALTAPDPGEIAAQMVGLESAVRQMSEWAGKGGPADPEERALLRAELEALQGELRGTERLIENGEEFWRGWARLLGMDTGYTPSGLPGVLEATSPRRLPARVEVEG
jgi:hypothetical protein